MRALRQISIATFRRHRRALIPALVIASVVPLLIGVASKGQDAPMVEDVRSVHRVTPLITGVQLHFGSKIETAGYEPEQTLGALRALGAGSVRDNLSWPRLEQVPGPDIAVRFPALVALTRRPDAVAPPMLTPSGALASVDGGGLPRSSEGLRAFADFVADAATPWRGTAPLIEIWNEWDRGVRRGDYGTPGGYAALVKAAAPAIRRAVPDAKILAGGASDANGQFRFEWTKAMIDAGGLDAADGLTVHLYNHCSPPKLAHAADELLGRLDDLHAHAMARAAAKSDIYVSEFGWPTNNGKCGIDPQAAAENVAQFILEASTRPWLRGLWYYELKDSGRDPAAIEDNFGLLTFDYRPKPAFCAYKAAAAIVRDAQPVRVVRQGGATRVDFTGADGPISVIWLADRGRPMEFSTGAESLQPLCGTARRAAGEWAALTARPIVVRGAGVPLITFRASG